MENLVRLLTKKPALTIANSQSHETFGEIVRRHVNFVYCIARRQMPAEAFAHDKNLGDWFFTSPMPANLHLNYGEIPQVATNLSTEEIAASVSVSPK